MKKRQCFCFEVAPNLKINESRYITLFLVSGSIKKLFPIDYVNIYLFSICFSIDFEIYKKILANTEKKGKEQT